MFTLEEALNTLYYYDYFQVTHIIIEDNNDNSYRYLDTEVPKIMSKNQLIEVLLNANYDIIGEEDILHKSVMGSFRELNKLYIYVE